MEGGHSWPPSSDDKQGKSALPPLLTGCCQWRAVTPGRLLPTTSRARVPRLLCSPAAVNGGRSLLAAFFRRQAGQECPASFAQWLLSMEGGHSWPPSPDGKQGRSAPPPLLNGGRSTEEYELGIPAAAEDHDRCQAEGQERPCRGLGDDGQVAGQLAECQGLPTAAETEGIRSR